MVRIIAALAYIIQAPSGKLCGARLLRGVASSRRKALLSLLPPLSTSAVLGPKADRIAVACLLPLNSPQTPPQNPELTNRCFTFHLQPVAAPWFCAMAKLTDLPDDLVLEIIKLTIKDPLGGRYRYINDDHHTFDLEEIRGIPKKTRPHLEDRTYFGNYHSPRDDYRGKERENVPPVSWPEGIPRNPYVTMSLVSRNFRRCAQHVLFNNVALEDQWQASLFLQALIHPSPHDKRGRAGEPTGATGHHDSGLNEIEGAPSSGTDSPRLNVEVARNVHSLQFKWAGPGSMGKGGGRLICEILRRCPLLENIAIGPMLFHRCKEPIFEALASRKFIKEFVVLRKKYMHNSPMLDWRADEVITRLFSRWDFLETIEIPELLGQSDEAIETIPQSVRPLPNCTLTTVILERPDLNEMELSWLLKGSIHSMQTLKILRPTSKLDSSAMCRILKECTGPQLESLTLELGTGNSRGCPESCGLLDTVFESSSALRKLKSLSLDSFPVSQDFLTLLPESLIKFASDNNEFSAASFFSTFFKESPSLSDTKVNEHSTEPVFSRPQFTDEHDRCVHSLPNLKCFSVRLIRMQNKWRKKDADAITEFFKSRGVCFHIPAYDTYDDERPLPNPHWQDLDEHFDPNDDYDDHSFLSGHTGRA
ncbi:hypothetical protein PtA15_7A508 [Puccinia triticina]|uniref:F-box domain-containing protein n=1 Tax=Puccinia triticina TaxID=208348 RepID=A0ABY7CNP1_9BASI|nr:uncharacterized protein PtA15_7A508 [Puccinia triticina]WAQ86779.1 hypothetical protein PtA15_7A508 [Puccinia triticina]WAR56646.1 hypothetical protein PtB15_7B496 [Puccinia triticina]